MKKRILSTLLAALMLLSLLPVAALAEDAYQYVSIGASNTNGYGLRGYLDGNLYTAPWTVKDEDISGYQQHPENAYPELICKELAKTKGDVNLTQLAMSGMRVEELRMLLDESYTGDAYTAWRFEGEGGEEWFKKAGGLDKLRKDYKEAITNADLISVDIGANNFGVYLSNRLFNNMYDNDMSRVLSEKELKIYNQVESTIESWLKSESGLTSSVDPDLMAKLKAVADTYAYALVGFCTNFDASIEAIRKLNPTADIVVVSIQNPIAGLTLNMKGVADISLPVGDLNGYIVNMANIYMASVSPNANSYYCADVRKNGHVTSFVDDFKNYNGDPSTLTQSLKDCFDVYQDDLYLKTRIQHLFLTNILSSPISLNDYETAVAAGTGVIPVPGVGEVPFDQTFEQTFAQLFSLHPEYYTLYTAALNNAYDALMTGMKAGVSSDEVMLAALADNTGAIEDYLMLGVNKLVEKAAIQAVNVEHTYDNQLALDNGKPFNIEDAVEGLLDGDLTAFLTMDEIAGLLGDADYQELLNALFTVDKDGPSITCKVSPEVIRSIANMGIRISISNSFASHPNEKGHQELADAILYAQSHKVKGSSIIQKEVYALGSDAYKLLKDWFVQTITHDQPAPAGSTTLQNGTLIMKLGGKNKGEFTFEQNDTGWNIKNADGKYLAMKDGKLAYSDEAFAWTYKNGAFSVSEKTEQKSGGHWFGWIYVPGSNKTVTTTYYLSTVTDGDKLSTKSVRAELYTEIAGDHVWGAWTDCKDGANHKRVCKHCGMVETAEHSYDPDTHECVCGAYDPACATVDVSATYATKTQKQSGGLLGRLFGWSKKTTTTYTATVNVNAVGVKVTKVEVAASENGAWTKSNTFTSNSEIEQFYARVTTSDGAKQLFMVKNGIGRPAN